MALSGGWGPSWAAPMPWAALLMGPAYDMPLEWLRLPDRYGCLLTNSTVLPQEKCSLKKHLVLCLSEQVSEASAPTGCLFVQR